MCFNYFTEILVRPNLTLRRACAVPEFHKSRASDVFVLHAIFESCVVLYVLHPLKVLQYHINIIDMYIYLYHVCVSLVLPLFLVGLASKPSFLASPFHPLPLSSPLDDPGRFSKPFQPPTVTSSAYRKPSLPLALVSIPPMPMILDYTHLLLFFSPVAYDSMIIRSILL